MVKKDLVIIAYDIQSDRQRAKVSQVLSLYGQRANYSVFECRLSKKQLYKVTNEIIALIDSDTDRILFYPLCKNCFLNSYYLGRVQDTEDTSVIGV